MHVRIALIYWQLAHHSPALKGTVPFVSPPSFPLRFLLKGTVPFVSPFVSSFVSHGSVHETVEVYGRFGGTQEVKPIELQRVVRRSVTVGSNGDVNESVSSVRPGT